MKRRQHLAMLAGVTLIGALPARAQTGNAPRRVSVLYPGTSGLETSVERALREGLQALGWFPGRNLLLQAHFADGSSEKLQRLAAEIVRAAPDAIVANSPAAAMAFKSTATNLPIVFIAVWDPMALGLAQSLAHPGGTYTGLSTTVPGGARGFFTKQIGLLREAAPNISRLAMLRNPHNPMQVQTWNQTGTLVRKLGLEPILLPASTAEEIGTAFAEAARQRANALFVSGDPFFMTQRPLIAELALRQRLPSMSLFHETVVDGGLMSYGTDLSDLSRRAADYVDRILKGALPRDLPIQQPTKFELAINLKTAKALGLKLPQSLLISADRVIE